MKVCLQSKSSSVFNIMQSVQAAFFSFFATKWNFGATVGGRVAALHTVDTSDRVGVRAGRLIWRSAIGQTNAGTSQQIHANGAVVVMMMRSGDEDF